MSSRDKFQDRANTAFHRQVESMGGDISAMLSDHSAKGRLQSGSTIIESVRIFEEHSAQALRQTLEEAARIIEHRGRDWNEAMLGIGAALDHHIASARAILEPTFRVADRKGSPSISRAADQRIEEAGARLRNVLADFRDGWTTPSPKQWKDRHPFGYAVLLLVIGAALALGGTVAGRLLNGEKSPAAARTNP